MKFNDVEQKSCEEGDSGWPVDGLVGLLDNAGHDRRGGQCHKSKGNATLLPQMLDFIINCTNIYRLQEIDVDGMGGTLTIVLGLVGFVGCRVGQFWAADVMLV